MITLVAENNWGFLFHDNTENFAKWLRHAVRFYEMLKQYFIENSLK